MTENNQKKDTHDLERDAWESVFGSSAKRNYVYHYTSKEAALEKILSNRVLKFGTFETVNDPRESQDWCFTEIYDSTQVCFVSLSETPKKAKYMSHLAKGLCKLFCVAKDDLKYPGADKSLFYKGYARPRMWSQYAGNHTGVCLVFDEDILNTEIESHMKDKSNLFHDSVAYDPWSDDEIAKAFTILAKDIKDNGLESTIRDHIKKHIKELFFLKAPDWSHESESRWLILDNNPNPVFLPYGRALSGIVLGSNFNEVYYPAIAKLCSEQAIPIANLIWQNGLPELNHRPVDLFIESMEYDRKWRRGELA